MRGKKNATNKTKGGISMSPSAKLRIAICLRKFLLAVIC